MKNLGVPACMRFGCGCSVVQITLYNKYEIIDTLYKRIKNPG